MKKATTEKKVVTKELYEAAVKDYVNFHNEYARLAAARDKKVAAIDAEYGTRFEELKNCMQEQSATVQTYCEEHRESLFTESKSLELFGAKIGFRLGQNKVSLLKGFKLKEVVERLVKLKAWQPYVRMKPELNKEALLAAKPKGMEKYGLTIEQEEGFFLEPEKTEIEE